MQNKLISIQFQPRKQLQASGFSSSDLAPLSETDQKISAKLDKYEAYTPALLSSRIKKLHILFEVATDLDLKARIDSLLDKIITEYSVEMTLLKLSGGRRVIHLIHTPKNEPDRTIVISFLARQISQMSKKAFINFAQENILTHVGKQNLIEIQKIAHINNQIRFSIIAQILCRDTPKERKDVYRLFRSVMEECLKNKDFASAFEIHSALTHSSVCTLEEIKKEESKKPLDETTDLFSPSRNFTRLMQEQKDQACIPVVQMYFQWIESTRASIKQNVDVEKISPIEILKLVSPLITTRDLIFPEDIEIVPASPGILAIFNNTYPFMEMSVEAVIEENRKMEAAFNTLKDAIQPRLGQGRAFGSQTAIPGSKNLADSKTLSTSAPNLSPTGNMTFGPELLDESYEQPQHNDGLLLVSVNTSDEEDNDV